MSVKKKNKKIYEQKKTPQNGGTEGGLVVRQKGRPYASLQILVYHGKNPNARKKCAAGTEKQPDKLFGFLAGTKKPPLKFAGDSYYSVYVGIYHHRSTAPISQP
jgi:hypothetical protein